MAEHHKRQEYEDFLRLILENKSRIYSYILRLVPNRAVADDLMQETTLVMWEKFAQFELGGNFTGWGIRIARIKILQHRNAASRLPIYFSQDVFESLADSAEQELLQPRDDKSKALGSCLKKLSKRDYELIQLRYSEKQKIKDIARNLQWPLRRTYKLMAKIHYILKECIEKRLSLTGASE